jgi:hypothetical protein
MNSHWRHKSQLRIFLKRDTYFFKEDLEKLGILTIEEEVESEEINE